MPMGKKLMFAVWGMEKQQGRGKGRERSIQDWDSHCVWNCHEYNVSAAG